jgi:hypothetical protein
MNERDVTVLLARMRAGDPEATRTIAMLTNEDLYPLTSTDWRHRVHLLPWPKDNDYCD